MVRLHDASTVEEIFYLEAMGLAGSGEAPALLRQLRGEAGVRQHANARLGLAHMIGVGAACVVHVLGAP